MQVVVTGHHFTISDAIRDRVREEAEKLTRYYRPIVDASMTITPDGGERRADLVVNVHAHTLKSTGKAQKVYLAIDDAMEKMERQLKKLRDKQRRVRPPSAPQHPDTEE